MPQFLPKDAEKLLAELRDKREAAATETSPGEPVTASPKNVAPPEFTPEKVEKPGKATLEADDAADFAKVLASDPYLAAAESDTEHFDNFEDYHFALWVKGLGLDFDGSITPTEPESDTEIMGPDVKSQCVACAPSDKAQAGLKRQFV